MELSFTFGAVAAALAAQAVTSQKPLEPSGQWTVDYAETSCTLNRQFGTGRQLVALTLAPQSLSDRVRVSIATPKPLEKSNRGQGRLVIDNGSPIQTEFVGWKNNEGNYVTTFEPRWRELDGLRTAKLLNLKATSVDWALTLGNISGALNALEACQRELLVHWGMAASVAATIKTLPFHPDGLPSLFRDQDYPYLALRSREQGTAGVKLWIGKDGLVTDCKVVESSRSSTLDSYTCSIIEGRARFEPARTAAGEPVAAIGFQRVRWEFPSF